MLSVSTESGQNCMRFKGKLALVVPEFAHWPLGKPRPRNALDWLEPLGENEKHSIHLHF